MGTNREKIENRIFEILTYIGNNTLAYPLKENISMFSTGELEYVLEFLESGKLEHIYKLLDEKYKEYLGLLEEIKMIKISNKKNNKLLQEQEERKEEQKDLDLLLNF